MLAAISSQEALIYLIVGFLIALPGAILASRKSQD